LRCTPPSIPPSPVPRSAVAAEVLSAVKAVTVNDEICREIERLGGVETVVACLAPHVEGGILLPTAEAPAPPGVAAGAALSAAGAGSDTPAAADAAGSSTPTPVATPTAVTVDGVPVGAPAAAAAAAGATSAAGVGASGSPVVDPMVRRERMVRCGMAVLRAVANSDALKVRMCADAATPMKLMLAAMGTCAASAPVMDQTIAALGNLALRLPDNAARMVGAGVLPAIAAAMRAHGGHSGVQRSACLAVRNMVVRSKDRVAAAFEAGEGVRGVWGWSGCVPSAAARCLPAHWGG
jgi:hypothetical protein